MVKNEISGSECDSIDSPGNSASSLKHLQLIDKSANTDEKMLVVSSVEAANAGQPVVTASMVARLIGTDMNNGGVIVSEAHKMVEQNNGSTQTSPRVHKTPAPPLAKSIKDKKALMPGIHQTPMIKQPGQQLITKGSKIGAARQTASLRNSFRSVTSSTGSKNANGQQKEQQSAMIQSLTTKTVK